MDLARALTNRNRRQAVDASHYMGPARAASLRNGPIKRSAISNPVELISTTNVLALQAPNIYGSDNESDSSGSLGASSRATTPEMSPSDDTPIEPNHLSSYFKSDYHPARSSKDSIDNESSPKVPQRALSHTKKTHQAVAARKRSESNTIQPPNAIHNQSPFRETFSTPPESSHPFGAELAQVNEVAEGFNATQVIILDEEEQYLQSHGLCKFGAEEYVVEIQGLFNNPFSPFTPVWI